MLHAVQPRPTRCVSDTSTCHASQTLKIAVAMFVIAQRLNWPWRITRLGVHVREGIPIARSDFAQALSAVYEPIAIQNFPDQAPLECVVHESPAVPIASVPHGLAA